MSVEPLDDTLALLSAVASDFAKPDPGRGIELRDNGGHLDVDMWNRLADNGWFSIMVPEELGGAGLGVHAATIIARQLGYAGFPEPFVAAGLLAPLLLCAGEDPDREDRLAELMAGGILAAVAWQGPNGGFEPASLGVTVSGSGKDTVLNGMSRFTGVPNPDGYVVAARSADGVLLYWVTASTPGLSVVQERTADGMISAGPQLTRLDASKAVLLIGSPRAEAELLTALDVARVVASAELVGIVDRMIEMTIAYLQFRKQFGVPLGSFQALQHRVVDIALQRELAIAAMEAAVDVFEDPTTPVRARAAAASRAKARAAHAATLVCREALQLHGAIGFTDEYELGWYLRRSLTLAPWLGGTTGHRRRYAELVSIEQIG